MMAMAAEVSPAAPSLPCRVMGRNTGPSVIPDFSSQP
jgi:hypothetical protein